MDPRLIGLEDLHLQMDCKCFYSEAEPTDLLSQSVNSRCENFKETLSTSREK